MIYIGIHTIPFDVDHQEFNTEQINELIGSNPILSCKAEFFMQHGKAYWTVCLQ